ncbi:MAG: LysM peptidoglycan-binding domain-containing protein [Clostridiales bacterium]|nr:LysM peptidoglycan-binding domain-containing protein [Clostridiales bacterium]
MADRENMETIVLPKNIRQIGTFGERYRVYIEDFAYTYVHRMLHQKRREDAVLAAVLLGRTVMREDREYIFISGAQKVDFGMSDGSGDMPEGMPDTAAAKQAEFWDRVYRRMKQYFDDLEILGWYFNLDGSSLEVHPQLQQFFESTYKKGSRFLYFEDRLEQNDAIFVQEQHKLQRLTGYAVYYEKNPQMQQFMIDEKERMTPRPIRENPEEERQEDVVQNYRAIMNKLNEKPSKKRFQPVLYLAGAAVLVIVAATAVTQIGNYQNLKTLQQTMQALSGAVREGDTASVEEISVDDERTEDQGAAEESTAAAGMSAEGEDTSDSSDSSEEESTEADSVTANTPENADADTESTGADTSTLADAGEEGSAADTDSVTTSGGSLPDYYVVQKGDSLLSISQSIYSTDSKVEEICELNNIENMDMIYEGQKLLLP